MSRMIHLKDHVLLQHSKLIKKHKWLETLLKRYDEITEEIVNGLPLEQQKFLRNMINPIIEQARSEWRAEKNVDVDREKKTKCSICHYPTLKYKCYIINKFTEERLVVGQRCVTHFGLETETFKENLKKIVENEKRLEKLIKLNSEIEGIRDKIEGWFREIEEQPIVIINKLSEPYDDLRKKARCIYDDCLDGKIKYKKAAEELKVLLAEKERLYKKIQEYVEKYQNERFIVTRKTMNWLQSQSADDVEEAIRSIKQQGRITWKILHRIREPNIMRSLVPDINSIFQGEGIPLEIEKALPERRGYLIRATNTDHIKFFMGHQKFFLDYAPPVFEEEPLKPITIETMLDIMRLTSNSAVAAIEIFTQKVGKGRFSVNDYYPEQDDFIVYIGDNDNYYMPNLTRVADMIKGAVFDKIVNVSEVIEYIDKNHDLISKEDIDYFKQTRKDAIL